MHAEDPYCFIMMGDFNFRSTQWWENDSEIIEGTLFEQTTALTLHLTFVLYIWIFLKHSIQFGMMAFSTS